MLTARGPCQHRDPAHSREGLACSGSVAVVLLSPAGPEGPWLPGSKLSQQFVLSAFPEGRAKPGHQLARGCAITQMRVPQLGPGSVEWEGLI